MAAIFAGASQALLASVVFAFETTLQPFGLLPLLAGCTMAYLVARLLMKHSIMTEKIARRGLRVSSEYSVDMLDSVHVRDAASTGVVCLQAEQAAAEVQRWLASHEPGAGHTGFPVVNSRNEIVGMITRKDLARKEVDASAPLSKAMTSPPIAIPETASVREAIDLMVAEGVGRLPTYRTDNPRRVTGILTRSDILEIYRKRLHGSRTMRRTISVASLRPSLNREP
jgi:CBS domain-containing protein